MKLLKLEVASHTGLSHILIIMMVIVCLILIADDYKCQNLDNLIVDSLAIAILNIVPKPTLISQR